MTSRRLAARALCAGLACLLVAPTGAPAFTDAPVLHTGGAWLAHGVCSGVLVTPTRVLTAAHCVGPQGGYVHLGRGPRATETLPVAGVTVHPRFRNWVNPRAPNSSAAEAGRYDIAILTLAQPARTEPLPIARHSAAPGTRAHGYGFAKERVARRARQMVMPDARCRAAYPRGSFDARATLCAGDPGPGPRARICGGDSGGPLVAGGRVIGLVTFAAEVLFKPCGSGPALGGYADVGALSGFVLQAHPAFLPVYSRKTTVARDGELLRCMPPAFAPDAVIRSVATDWQRRDLRTGHFTVRPIAGRHAQEYGLRGPDAGTQIRCHQRITTPGGPIEQLSDWLAIR